MLSAFLDPKSAVYRLTRQMEAAPIPQQRKSDERSTLAAMMSMGSENPQQAYVAVMTGQPLATAMTGQNTPSTTPVSYTPPTSDVEGLLAGTDGMSGDFVTALNSMYSAMPEDIRSGLSINSGFRSPEQQAQIISNHFGKYGFSGADRAAWDADVASLGPIAAGQKWADLFSQSGMRKWIAIPGGSQHQRGYAGDLGFGSDAVREWVHANAGNYGLHFPMSWEPWHIELQGVR